MLHDWFLTRESWSTPGGILWYKRDGGGGGVRRIFSGLKFSTSIFFWVEDLTVYFFESKKSARIFLGSNFRQANSSYAIQAKVPARSKSMIRIISSLVFFWVQNVRLRRTPPSPARHVYTRVPHLGGARYSRLLTDLHWLPIKQRIIFKILVSTN